jgi:hypothetical protein
MTWWRQRSPPLSAIAGSWDAVLPSNKYITRLSPEVKEKYGKFREKQPAGGSRLAPRITAKNPKNASNPFIP